MEIKWTSKALSDLSRLYEFLVPTDATAAAKTVRSLTSAPNTLSDQPRLGERLDAFEPRKYAGSWLAAMKCDMKYRNIACIYFVSGIPEKSAKEHEH